MGWKGLVVPILSLFTLFGIIREEMEGGMTKQIFFEPDNAEELDLPDLGALLYKSRPPGSKNESVRSNKNSSRKRRKKSSPLSRNNSSSPSSLRQRTIVNNNTGTDNNLPSSTINHNKQSSFARSANPATTEPKYAYSFVIGGCNPTYPTYKHYIYNIMVATKILREQGSTADFFALFQMAYSVEETTLPARYVRMLQAMSIEIQYIPKQDNESFYRTQLDKFRILSFTQYSRVLFMDGDIMPMANLDYLFELSEQGVLKENLVMRGVNEPANGGFFMLKPKPGYLDEIQEIIRIRELNNTVTPHFDTTIGWGHKIVQPDEWLAQISKGNLWDFLAAYADQGLLYHWVKYVRKNVSFYLEGENTIENWSAGPDGTVQKEGILLDVFANHSKPIACFRKRCTAGPPLRDTFHFTGRSKPWLHPFPEDLSYNTRLKSDLHHWFYHLDQLNTELHMNINFTKWLGGKTQKPILGLYPHHNQVVGANTNLLTPLTRETRNISTYSSSDEVEFCPNCIWQGEVTCQFRKNFLKMKTGDSDQQVTSYLMKNYPVCLE